MGVFGEFAFGEDVYGPGVDVRSADILTPCLVRISFDSLVVIDSAYHDVSNYAIEVLSGTQLINVRHVLAPAVDARALEGARTLTDGPNTVPPANATGGEARTAREVVLCVDQMIDGDTYKAVATNLRSTKGVAVSSEGKFIGRRTKAATMLKELPSHFDDTPDSIVSAVLLAIGIEDDAIGGATGHRHRRRRHRRFTER